MLENTTLTAAFNKSTAWKNLMVWDDAFQKQLKLVLLKRMRLPPSYSF